MPWNFLFEGSIVTCTTSNELQNLHQSRTENGNLKLLWSIRNLGQWVVSAVSEARYTVAYVNSMNAHLHNNEIR